MLNKSRSISPWEEIVVRFGLCGRICVFALLLSCYLSPHIYAQRLEGAWVGYVLDLQELKKDQLPNLYPVKVMLAFSGRNTYRGILYKYVAPTITITFDGIEDAKSHWLSTNFHEHMASDPSFVNNCNVFSTLSIVQKDGRTILEGRYYGINGDSNNFCPSGKVYLERPQKTTAEDFNYLATLLKQKHPAHIPVSHRVHITPRSTPLNQHLPSPTQKNMLHFPDVIVSINPRATIEDTSYAQVDQLMRTQPLKRFKKPISINTASPTFLLSSKNILGDTLNLLFEKTSILTNYQLNPSSQVKLEIDSPKMSPNSSLSDYRGGFDYVLTIAPFSMTHRTMELFFTVLNKRGDTVQSFPISLQSNQNLEIPIVLAYPN